MVLALLSWVVTKVDGWVLCMYAGPFFVVTPRCARLGHLGAVLGFRAPLSTYLRSEYTNPNNSSVKRHKKGL